MATCTCGNENAVGSRFCESCGTPLATGGGNAIQTSLQSSGTPNPVLITLRCAKCQIYYDVPGETPQWGCPGCQTRFYGARCTGCGVVNQVFGPGVSKYICLWCRAKVEHPHGNPAVRATAAQVRQELLRRGLETASHRHGPHYYADLMHRGAPLPPIPTSLGLHSRPVPRPGEVLYFECPATLKELRTVNKGTRGGKVAVALPIPVIGGAVRVGGSQGHVVTENRWVPVSHGMLMLTNLRILLHPTGVGRQLAVNLDAVVSYSAVDMGLMLHVEGADAPFTLGIQGPGDAESFGLCLGYVLSTRPRTPQPQTSSEPAAALPATPPAPAGDKYDVLRKLAELRSDGILTEDEFQQEKAKCLGGPTV